MGDNATEAVTEKVEDTIKKTTSFFGADPYGKIGWGLGSLVFPPLATFASSKNQFMDGIKKSGALDTLKETGIVKEDFMKDQELSPREEAARQVKGSFKKTRAYTAETEFWDRLYDEPCWINPATGSFELGTAFSKLWCTWFMEDDPTKQVEKLMGNRNLLFRTVLDKKKLLEIFLQNEGETDNDAAKYEEFNEAMQVFLGEVDSNMNGKPPAEIGGNGDKATEFVPHEKTGSKEELAKALSLSVEDVDQAIEKKAAGPVSLLSSSPTGLLKQTEVSLDEETRAAPCNKGKWFFCLFMKFLLGPAGLLILKFMPYVVQLILNIWNFFGRLFLGFTNTYYDIRGFPDSKRAYVYKNQYNETVKDYYPNYVSTVASYIGLVFPWKIISYDKGQRYGNGEFGKFIFSLMLLSVGLITMGSITVVVFLLVLSYYLVKTLSMFTSNIDSKKKK